MLIMDNPEQNWAGPGGNGCGGRIRGVILDFGEVVCYRPSRQNLERMATALGLAVEEFAARYGRDRAPYDRGDVTPRDYWLKVAPNTVELTENLLHNLRRWDVEMWAKINPEMTEWLARLRATGFKTALLSNMHCDMVEYARRNFEWLKALDYAVLSSEVRLIKPDPAIYQRCVEGLALPPSAALFIDDRDVNVRAAIDAGLAALRFQSVDSLRNDLVNMRFPVLPNLQ
jgi:putative hydrolase of the HAD superfamily